MLSMNSRSTTPSSSAPGNPHKRRRKAAIQADEASRAFASPHTAGKRSPTAAGGGGGSTTTGTGGGGGGGGGGGSSSFRNVSACNRCRLRKNRCDQRLPACLSCEKAGVKCVGYDPITKREIPRSYVHYLETRTAYLESLLASNGIAYAPADSFPDLPAVHPSSATPTPTTVLNPPLFPAPAQPSRQSSLPPIDPALEDDSSSLQVKQESPEVAEEKKLDNLVSDIGLVSFAGASDPRYLGSVSGISFARVVFAAVKSSSIPSNDQNGGDGSQKARFRPRHGSTTRVRGSRGLGIGGGVAKEEIEDEDADTQMRDSFFGLHTKPTITPAPFPNRATADRLVNLYFEHANPQTPILHRGEFATVVDAVYAPVDAEYQGTGGPTDFGVNGDSLGGGARERYLLNIVCAIGAGIFLTGPSEEGGGSDTQDRPRKKQKVDSTSGSTETSTQYEPESYHATAMLHLEAFLSQSKGGLEELQAVLLLASYALLRPVSPGLWYIVGVAVRLAVDLGLHYEDSESQDQKSTTAKNGKEGRRQWVRDMRRRLWWCVYSLDRLVSTCVGRPFGIADEVVTTKFPSILDDQYIHPQNGINAPPNGPQAPSYKRVSHHYFKLRVLQSEILQVLQQQTNTLSFSSRNGASMKSNSEHPAHHPFRLQTPFLHKFPSVQAWHKDVDRRLKEWHDASPKSKEETGVAFSPEFLELNYWQTKIMLYRPCLSVPVLLAGELGASGNNARSRAAEKGLGSGAHVLDQEEEKVYLVVAEAGSKVLRIYRKLHRVHQVNYTFLATHHLFMAGISFLYAIWHSPLVRSRLSMDDVDFTILAATSVLGDLVDKCPPAAACRDAFQRMSKATVQMCLAGRRGPAPSYQPRVNGPTGSPNYYMPEQANAGQPSDSFRHGPGEMLSGTQQAAYSPEYSSTNEYQQSMGGPKYSPSSQQLHVPGSHSATSSYPTIHQVADQSRRRDVHFDDGFRELFTSPRPQHVSTPVSSAGYPSHNYIGPSTPESMQYHPPLVYDPQVTGVYAQNQDMMIDPALQHGRQHGYSDSTTTPPRSAQWGNAEHGMDALSFAGVGSEWEHDSLNSEGGNVDLFDGFFFGGGN